MRGLFFQEGQLLWLLLVPAHVEAFNISAVFVLQLFSM